MLKSQKKLASRNENCIIKKRERQELLYLMRVLFCKIHCPSICFCKPSCHLYTPSTLKLENTPHAPSKPPTPPLHLPPSPEANNSLEESQAHTNGSDNGNVNGDENCNGSAIHLKSSLRKPLPESSPPEKKKVQWVDVLGQDLAEIKEFESSEEEDHDYGRMDRRGCVCTIL